MMRALWLLIAILFTASLPGNTKAFEYDHATVAAALGLQTFDAYEAESIRKFFANLDLNNRVSRRGAIPLPVETVPNTDPYSVVIPDGAAVIKFGIVITNVTGFPTNFYHELVYWGVRNAEYIINSRQHSTFVYQGNETFVQPVILSGGPSCSDYLILYDYLITQMGVDVIMLPVTDSCPQIALLGQLRNIVVLNPVDYTAAYLTQNGVGTAFYNASLVYSSTGDLAEFGTSCLLPVFVRGARTFATYYDSTYQSTTGLVDQTAVALGMRVAINATLIDSVRQAALGDADCSYLKPFVQEIVSKDPDLLVVGLGDVGTALVKCLHIERLYQTRGVFFVGGGTPSVADRFHFAYLLSNSLWADGSDYVDPVLGSIPAYIDTHVLLHGTKNLAQISYGAGFSAAIASVVHALNNTNLPLSMLPAALDAMNYTSITGPTYLITSSAGKNVRRTVYCQQRGNNASEPSGKVISPAGTPGGADPVYPALISWPQEYVNYVDGLYRKKKNHTLAIALGSTLGGLGFIAVLSGIAVLVLWKKYQVIFISKETIGPDEGNWA
jgi:hypothetical protein